MDVVVEVVEDSSVGVVVAEDCGGGGSVILTVAILVMVVEDIGEDLSGRDVGVESCLMC